MSKVYGQIDGVDVVDGATTCSHFVVYRYFGGRCEFWVSGRKEWVLSASNRVGRREIFATIHDVVSAKIPTNKLDHDPKLQAEVARARGETLEMFAEDINGDVTWRRYGKPIEPIIDPDSRTVPWPQFSSAPLPYGVHVVPQSVAFGLKGGE